MEARRGRRWSAVRRARHGRSCLRQDGALRARVRERVGQSRAGNPRQCERAHGPPSSNVSQHDPYLKRPTKPNQSAMDWATGIGCEKVSS